ncbi:hypothetical protein SO802_019254 [Lithocarpus litseifolius]|uniref:Uncharacterized protein n=1 Tax=Lithocarpus litseifolius TaxID=425828 RepID=A0AAW2CNM8_9ROSI
MEATDSTSTSYAWRSILKGRDFLLKGAKWRVGCGKSISVKGFEDIKVFDLIDPNSKSWDDSLLHGLFNLDEVSLIKSIPLCITSVEDKLVWPFIASGEYMGHVWLQLPSKGKFEYSGFRTIGARQWDLEAGLGSSGPK